MNNLLLERENPFKSHEISNRVKDIVFKYSLDWSPENEAEVGAILMFLRCTFLLLLDELEPFFSDNLKSLLQTEDSTCVDPKKLFEDYFKKQSNPYNSEAIFSHLSKLNTVFYILYELKREKIDTSKIFVDPQESTQANYLYTNEVSLPSQKSIQNMKELVEIMSKLKLEDLEELIKLNNRSIGNFRKNCIILCLIIIINALIKKNFSTDLFINSSLIK